jgi:hypothetical protein
MHKGIVIPESRSGSAVLKEWECAWRRTDGLGRIWMSSGKSTNCVNCEEMKAMDTSHRFRYLLYYSITRSYSDMSSIMKTM